MQILPAQREQIASADAVRLATWRVAYRGIVPDAVLDALATSEDKLTWLLEQYDEGLVQTFVAVHDGQLVGMAARGPCRDEDRAGQPELYALYVLPEHWGSGAGQGLWEACQPICSLWVLEANTRARAFYARNGLRPEAHKLVQLGGLLGVALPELRYLLGS